jgi:divalent metal cation (Fe/Co/Zn/Cd) transporter
MNKAKWLQVALWLSIFTIVYNIIEGLVSVYFGNTDNTLVLLGFGVDSFVEVVSGIGILHMVLRMKRTEIKDFDAFERLALRITGGAFILLAVGLVSGSLLNIVNKSKPETTVAGIIIASVSIVTMYFLMHYKLKAGKALNSEAIIADAHCTKTCLYLSFILLVSSLLYAFFKISYIDVAGSIAIAWYALIEGRESLEKAKKNQLSCSCEDCHEKP